MVTTIKLILRMLPCCDESRQSMTRTVINTIRRSVGQIEDFDSAYCLDP